MVEPIVVLITGDRHWLDFEPIKEYVDTLPKNTILVEGGAPGVDTLAYEAGHMRGWQRFIFNQDMDYGYDKIGKRYFSNNIILGHKSLAPAIWEFPAKWEYPQMRSGGPIRNSAMLAIAAPDIIVGFHNNIAKSKGTKDMLRKGLSHQVPTFLYQRRCCLYHSRIGGGGIHALEKGDLRLKR